MVSPDPLTAEQYADQKFDLTDGGRWTELVKGRVITLQPPDDAHGNIVRNLTLAFSNYIHAGSQGYACFELGLVTTRKPDTVRCPPLCFFTEGELFEHLDEVVSTSKPQLVVEIASSNDRRRGMDQKILEYQASGMKLIWVVDPFAKQIHVFEWARDPKEYSDHQTLHGTAALDGFQMPVSEIFAEPGWWTAKAKNGH